MICKMIEKLNYNLKMNQYLMIYKVAITDKTFMIL
jgi:hypothetical protein